MRLLVDLGLIMRTKKQWGGCAYTIACDLAANVKKAPIHVRENAHTHRDGLFERLESKTIEGQLKHHWIVRGYTEEEAAQKVADDAETRPGKSKKPLSKSTVI